eukprot:CAMPEP_0113495464 /NCGR_PEP_ID=MMETSP0014_2-20120614/29624_1 /TAXON_ID=2857 /ORGANISM="Nitzschia sp." /LENGTH=289 /DNA_ID=CAMNT_0000389365 /DNA_START=316 /DNA_END=1185 /DNA_ORIENTATION=- /assembly_acc=CAM_ASM_000159
MTLVFFYGCCVLAALSWDQGSRDAREQMSSSAVVAFSPAVVVQRSSSTTTTTTTRMTQPLYSTKPAKSSTTSTNTKKKKIPSPTTITSSSPNLPPTLQNPLVEDGGEKKQQEPEDKQANPSLEPINDFNFRTLLNGSKPVLVDACSKHCGPCRLIEPTLTKFADDFNDEVSVVKFDIQDRLSQQFKVEMMLAGHMPQALPTLLLFHNGQVLTKWRGIVRYEQLEGIVEEHIRPLELDLGSTESSETEITEPKSRTPHQEDSPNDDGHSAGVVNLASMEKADDYMLTSDY